MGALIMPAFDTPGPLRATIEVPLGGVRISAGDRATTAVDVLPSDATNDDDRRAAELTRVEYANGHLVVKAPKPRVRLGRSSGGSVEVAVELPAGSRVQAFGQAADFDCDGALGDCRIVTGLGHIRLDSTAALNAQSGSGDIGVDRVTGSAEVKTGSGAVRIRELGGSAVIRNSNGDTWIGAAGGNLRLKAANGDVAVDVARASVVAKTANGDVRVGDVARGSVVLETHMGDVEVGIREGTAAWLDVNASAGRVHNALAAAEAPESSAEAVRVRARTSIGDIVIRRP
jgi:hypothetical protein